MVFSSANADPQQSLNSKDAAEPASSPPKPSTSSSGSINGADESAAARVDEGPPAKTPKGIRFWLIIFSLLIATFLSALDLTSISTALPKIAEELESQDYAWIGNAYSITSTCFIPWLGGLSDIFGRRPVLLVGLVSFAVGSAMCGAANTMNVMLAGRSFQGFGAGVILTLVEIILADLVSLAERGAYQGAFGAVWALASATGPPIGGAFASSNYRWLFYMNLPLSAVVIAVVVAFMKLKTPPGTWRSKLARMDWIGNLIFIPSITLLTVGLLKGGQPNPWSSVAVLAPLIIGAVGLVLWYFVERYVVRDPTVPFDLLLNRTSTIGFVTTLVHGISALCLFYFWPVYFQAVKGASPVRSAVDFFSVAFVVAPFAMVAGGSIGALQVYKPQNVIAWILMTLGPGLMYLITADSPPSAWIPLPIPFSIGVGLLYAASVFPVLAPLSPSLAGRALSFLVFCRSVGNIFGITVGSTVLAQELGKRLPQAFLDRTPGGVAGAYSAIPTIKDLEEPLRTEVREAFAKSVQVIWLVLIPFGAVGLGMVVWMKELKLQTVTDEQWGLKQKVKRDEEGAQVEKRASL